MTATYQPCGYCCALTAGREDGEPACQPGEGCMVRRRPRIRRRGPRPPALLLTAFGRSQTYRAWQEETGIDYRLLRNRLRIGWSPERTVSTPIGRPGGPRRAA